MADTPDATDNTDPAGILVRPAARADADAVARTLARAFADDPPMAWVLPDPVARPRRLHRFFLTLQRRQVLRGGGALVACRGERIIGAALWLPPGTWSQSPVRQLIALPGYARAFGRRLDQGAVISQASYEAHPREPHWYLYTLGVHPDHQRTGAGTALLRTRLDECDRAGLPAYLESSKPGNVPYYERFGFQADRPLKLPAGAPAITPMWRPARPVPPLFR